MQITVTFTSKGESIDLLINQKQKIKDTLDVIEEVQGLPDVILADIHYVKSLRMNRRLSVFSSYAEEGVFSGDILEICI